MIQMLKLIGQFIQVALFFGKLWKESNKKKAKEKAELGKEIVDAFTETNKKRRASYLNNVVGKLRE